MAKYGQSLVQSHMTSTDAFSSSQFYKNTRLVGF
nr:MAG TPA: hypothetical protein [Caudoviricetes sp.]